MSIKDKLENLLDSANNTTGKTDADLTAAIKSLEDGYGGGGGNDGIILPNILTKATATYNEEDI